MADRDGNGRADGRVARVIGPVAGGTAFQRAGVASPYLGGAVVMAACAMAVRARRLPARR